MIVDKSIDKYLTHYTDSRSNIAKTLSYLSYTHGLVIPIYDEYQNCINLLINLTSLELNGKLLVTFVINDNELSPEQAKQNNKCLYDFFLSKKIIIQNNNFALINHTENIDIAIFYLCEERHIQSKQGVGLARKIGCDFILQISQNNKSKIKWIHCTDSDVILPVDYFKQIPNDFEKQVSAYIYNFKHYVPDRNDEVISAIQIYENSLRAYIKGLSYAGSTYAYQTIGSLIAISPLHYAQVRGFPKISAAEDFYLLNKLAKIAKIKTLQGEKIKLQARLSARVPFGTGPALKKIIQKDNDFISSLDYPIEAFEKLKTVINFINHLPFKNAENNLKALHLDIHQNLQALGFFNALSKIEKNTKDILKIPKHMHDWFDGFKTLKFIRNAKNT